MTLSARSHRELALEAKRQDAAPEALAAHAVMYFLAEWDSGRAAARLGAVLKRDDAEAD